MNIFWVFYIDKTSHWIFWKRYYLFLRAVYQCGHVLCKLGKTPPRHFDENGIPANVCFG